MPDSVLLTAAAEGIAYELAHHLGAQGHPTVLVTPVDGELDWIAAELVLRGAIVRTIACDLEVPGGPQALFDELAADGIGIDMLINHVGSARPSGTELPIRQCLSNPFLDVETALRMTALFLPGMLERGHGHILNASSAVGSVRPAASPRLTSEAFLLAWTEALARDLAGSPVTVAAFVNPARGREALAGTGVAALHGESSQDPPAARALAEAAYNALLTGNPRITAGASAAGIAQSRTSSPQRSARAQWFAATAELSPG